MLPPPITHTEYLGLILQPIQVPTQLSRNVAFAAGREANHHDDEFGAGVLEWRRAGIAVEVVRNMEMRLCLFAPVSSL